MLNFRSFPVLKRVNARIKQLSARVLASQCPLRKAGQSTLRRPFSQTRRSWMWRRYSTVSWASLNRRRKLVSDRLPGSSACRSPYAIAAQQRSRVSTSVSRTCQHQPSTHYCTTANDNSALQLGTYLEAAISGCPRLMVKLSYEGRHHAPIPERATDCSNRTRSTPPIAPSR